MSIFVFLFCFVSIQVCCGWICRKGSGKSETIKKSFNEEYFFSGRTLTFFPLMMTFIATQIGGGLLLGAAEASFQYGLASCLYPLGVSLGLIILGYGPGKKLAASGMSTIPQIFQQVYNSQFLKRMASSLSIISLFLILSAQIIASDKFFSGIGLSGGRFLFVFWIVVLGYTTLGGFRAVVKTDILQAGFLIGAVLLCGVVLLVSPISANFKVSSSLALASAIPYKKLWGWLFMPLLFMFIEQDMGQRCFAAESPKTLKKAAVTAGIVTLCFNFIPLLIGTAASKAGLVAEQGQSILMIAVTAFTNPVVTGVMACAVPIAIMSTADSLLNSICLLICEEFIPERLSSKRLWLFLTPLIAVSAVCVAYCFNDIVDVLILSYGLSVTALAVPVLTALFVPGKYSALAGYGSVFCGGATFIFLRIYPYAFFPAEIFGVVASLLGFCSAEFLKRKFLTSSLVEDIR